MKYRLLAGGSVLVLTAALSACSTPSDSASGDGRTTVDVWLMRDSVSDTFQKEFTADFEKRHPKIDVKIQIQEWDGIGQKITAALASNDAPDVIEAGNTQVAQFAESGGLLDLSDRTDELNGEDWLSGLAEPGAYEGKQYGIPYYAANRVVIHRTDLFEKAGIDAQAIKTREQWIDATAKLNKGGTQGIYLPGQLWYALAASSGTRAATSPPSPAGSGRARWTPPRRCAAWRSTRSSRRSARGPRTPTRTTRRRPR